MPADQPSEARTAERPPLDARLVQWMAIQALQDRHARLAEGGAEIGARIDLTSLFIDLPASSLRRDHAALRLLLAGGATTSSDRPRRWLLLGGPGSGKSTLTTMLAQQLRAPWIDRQLDALTAQVHDEWLATRDRLRTLAQANEWNQANGTLPLRVNLPALARWMSSQPGGSTLSLWHYLAARLVADLASMHIAAEITAPELCGAIEGRAAIFWIFDGLDEVPPSAGRSGLIDLIRGAACDAQARGASILVTTRPQGYGGEFDALYPLALQPLNHSLALQYGEKLLQAWLGTTPAFEERRAQMRAEFTKTDVAGLLHSPLHTTMAAILVAQEGSLPNARSLLFEHYFDTIFTRELGKPFTHDIQKVDKGLILTLHARAGLLLHVRSQAQTGARPSLRRRELRALLAALYTELGIPESDVRDRVDRIMRFAADRLVLLLHASEGEYTFSVRSLQEYFAALGLMEGDTAGVHERLSAIALDPHWSNVLAFVVSASALKTSAAERRQALQFTVDLCSAMNTGIIGGTPAARCFLGSQLALWMLQETEQYGYPWLHQPLWDVALQLVDSPNQTPQLLQNNTWSGFSKVHRRLGDAAADWTREHSETHLEKILQAAAGFLVGEETKLRGWQLLGGALDKDHQDAVKLAETHAPTTCEFAREVAEVLTDFWSGVTAAAPWLQRFLERHPDWFPPSWMVNHLGFSPSRDGSSANFTDVACMLQCDSDALSITWPGQDKRHGAPLCSIAWKPEARSVTIHADLAKEPKWAAWQRVLHFIASPSSATLADVLTAAGDHQDAFDELALASKWLPWPIELCVMHLPTPQTFRALADEVRAGRFGSTADWQAAETRWRTSPELVSDEFGVWLNSDGPWNTDIASRGVVLSDWPSSDLVDVSAVFQWLLSLLEARPPAPRRAWHLLHGLVTEGLSIPFRVAQQIEAEYGDQTPRHFRDLLTLLPDLEGPDADGWLTLLDKRGRAGLNVITLDDQTETSRMERLSGVFTALVEHIGENPDRWGLYDALTCLLFALPSADLSQLVLPELSPLPSLAEELHALLTLLTDRFEAKDLPALVARLRSETHTESDLPNILRERTPVHPHTTDILLAILDAQPPFGDRTQDAALAALYTLQRRALPAAFATQEAWRTYSLPEPFLQVSPPPPSPTWILAIPALHNIRLFGETPDIDIPFPQPSPEHGQWLVLVGENGVGKTTLLRALALALTSSATASKLLDERVPMIRNGGEGRVTVELDTGTLTIAVRRDDRTEVVHAPDETAVRPWVVGYGVRRGNARGEKDREAEVGPIGELHTLFDRPASLHGAVQWLRELDGDVLREQHRTVRQADAAPGPRERIWNAVQQALQVILGARKIEVAEGGVVQVDHPSFGRVRLDALSDGYLTTAGWIVDMIARWVDRQQALDEPIGVDLLRQMCGFVLIDEIDLHIHPMWQLRILADVRRLFPRLSFVVTTHNPLTLQGARRGEVYIMRRDGERIELVQRDIRPGHDFDRVLFEQFGVEHTFDRETRDLLASHRTMLEQQVPFADPERRKLEETLRERLGDASLKSGNPPDRSPLRPGEQPLLDSFFASLK